MDQVSILNFRVALWDIASVLRLVIKWTIWYTYFTLIVEATTECGQLSWHFLFAFFSPFLVGTTSHLILFSWINLHGFYRDPFNLMVLVSLYNRWIGVTTGSFPCSGCRPIWIYEIQGHQRKCSAMFGGSWIFGFRTFLTNWKLEESIRSRFYCCYPLCNLHHCLVLFAFSIVWHLERIQSCLPFVEYYITRLYRACYLEYKNWYICFVIFWKV